MNYLQRNKVQKFVTQPEILGVLVLSQLGIEHLELHEVALKELSENMSLAVPQQSSARSLSGILNYGTPSQRGVCVYIKEQSEVWDIALGTGPSQFLSERNGENMEANAKAKMGFFPQMKVSSLYIYIKFCLCVCGWIGIQDYF